VPEILAGRPALGHGRSRGYHRRVPIYEFRCGSCGERFEALVDAGTESVECGICGAAKTNRVLSAQAAPMSHVKSGGAARTQERKNARLQAGARADFKAKRSRAREARKGGGG
jgi:putative FmdB family regulatory protein